MSVFVKVFCWNLVKSEQSIRYFISACVFEINEQMFPFD